MGIGGPKKDMAVLMNLNHNGQAITLSRKLFDKGARDGAGLKALIERESARRLARLGGSQPSIKSVPRRRIENPA